MATGKLNFESDKILSSLSKRDKSLFLSLTEQIHFRKGKLIFYEKGIPTGVFLLKKGKAKIYKTGPYGKDQIFYIYKKGDMFGYHALLCNENYEDACEALEDCEVLFVSKSNFELLLQKIKKLNVLLLQNMSHEFGVMVNTITILAQKALRQRVAIYLLVLKDRYMDESTGKSFISISREDLANIIGTNRESLSRQLSEFKKEKFISIDGRIIEIIDEKKLNRISNA